MNITILESGFVTGDFLKPVGYEGERNSRSLRIEHPHFTDCYYQLVVKRYDGAYKLGIVDGNCAIPPSLLKTATDLECQFFALSTPESVSNSETDTFVFTSQPFTMKVASSLNLNNTEVIPTYEELQNMYKNIQSAKNIVDEAREDNERILSQINDILQQLRLDPVEELSEETLSAYRAQLQQATSDYVESGLLDDLVEEILNRIPDCGPLCDMTQEELDSHIRRILQDLKSEINSGSALWRGAYSMSQSGNVIGGR